MKKEVSCGALVYRYHKGERQFLIIKHVNGGHYGFPKGHVENKETHKQTAVREIKEETNFNVFIIDKYYTKVTYSPKENVIKDVYYYIAKIIDGSLNKQDEEVSLAKWVTFSQALNHLTYDNDKKVLFNLNTKINRIEKDIDPKVMSYVETHIIPKYQLCDPAHHADHIYQVTYDALKIAKDYVVNKTMLYVISTYHDIGLLNGRKTHHITGGTYLKNDSFIQSYFTSSDISVMVDAIYDHRASQKNEPRSIYGLIVSEADRQLNANNIMYRTALYEYNHHKDLTIEEQVQYCYEHMLEKYSENGYLTLRLKFRKNEKELAKLQKLIKDKNKILKVFQRLILKIKKYDKILLTKQS